MSMTQNGRVASSFLTLSFRRLLIPLSILKTCPTTLVVLTYGNVSGRLIMSS